MVPSLSPERLGGGDGGRNKVREKGNERRERGEGRKRRREERKREQEEKEGKGGRGGKSKLDGD